MYSSLAEFPDSSPNTTLERLEHFWKVYAGIPQRYAGHVKFLKDVQPKNILVPKRVILIPSGRVFETPLAFTVARDVQFWKVLPAMTETVVLLPKSTELRDESPEKALVPI